MIGTSGMLGARMSKMVEILSIDRTSVGRNATEWQKYQLVEMLLNDRCHCTAAPPKHSTTTGASIARPHT